MKADPTLKEGDVLTGKIEAIDLIGVEDARAKICGKSMAHPWYYITHFVSVLYGYSDFYTTFAS